MAVPLVFCKVCKKRIPVYYSGDPSNELDLIAAANRRHREVSPKCTSTIRRVVQAPKLKMGK